MAAPLIGMALVLGALGGFIGLLRLYQNLCAPHPEVVRKLLHMGMGLVTLSFPWLFEDAWPVVALAGLSISGLLGLRLLSQPDGLGSVVGGVKRVTLGEIYFPIAVAILFLLYLNEDPGSPELRLVLYSVPILLLAFADAAAALVGVGYGRWRYSTSDGEKSFEGSIAFFALAFFCVHVPVLLLTDTGRAETLLIALLLAWLAMMFEAISWRGLDNLVLPLVTFLLLRIYLDTSLLELERRLAVTAGLTAFLVLFHRRTTLAGSALLGAFLVGYISWALGGWTWLLAPLTVILTYTFLSPQTEANSRKVHNIHAVVSVASAGLIWLFLAKIMNRDDLLFPYTLAFAAHLAIIGIARLKFDFPQTPDAVVLVVCVTKGWLLLFVPYAVAQWFTTDIGMNTLRDLAISLAGVTVAAISFYATQPEIHDCPLDTPRWLRQAACAGLGSLLGLVPLHAL